MDDPIVFNADGSVDVATGDGFKPLHLRPPRLGEFKRLRQAIVLNSRQWTALLEQLRTSTDAQLDGEEADRRDRIEVEQVEVLADIFRTLGDHADWPTDFDDWPAWTVKPGLLTRLVTHWREVPLAPGPVTPSASPTQVTTGSLPPQ
jgi:hypothetical protein